MPPGTEDTGRQGDGPLALGALMNPSRLLMSTRSVTDTPVGAGVARTIEVDHENVGLTRIR